MTFRNAFAVFGLLAVIGFAQAQEAQKKSLGFYVGAEFGTSHTIATVQSNAEPPFGLNKQTGAWSGFIGLRPFKYLGAELSYADFGNARIENLSDGNGNVTYFAQSKSKATSLYLVGYVPLIANKWDLFAKAGKGRLKVEQSTAGNYPANCVSPPDDPSTCSPQGMVSASSRWSQTDFTYGIGTQYRFGSFGLRAEYQSIGNSSNRPSTYLLGAYWRF